MPMPCSRPCWGRPTASVYWPSLCVWVQVTDEAAMTNMSFHRSQDSLNDHAKRDTVVFHLMIEMQSDPPLV